MSHQGDDALGGFVVLPLCQRTVSLFAVAASTGGRKIAQDGQAATTPRIPVIDLSCPASAVLADVMIALQHSGPHQRVDSPLTCLERGLLQGIE
jgi:hypothetical protein